MEVVTAYRHLLKAVDKHIDEHVIRQMIKLAKDYALMLNSVHHHKGLLFSYNIAVDRSNEMNTIRKSAASVGLRLPDVYQP
ncbi:unnamed protein product [Victoria cruziana]